MSVNQVMILGLRELRFEKQILIKKVLLNPNVHDLEKSRKSFCFQNTVTSCYIAHSYISLFFNVS